MPQICKKLALGAVKEPRFVVVLSHLEGSYREAFLQFIGRQGSTLLRKG